MSCVPSGLRRASVWLAARHMPKPLRALRARVMLEGLADALGVEEVSCPACAGTGWLDRRRLEPCPICGGFREVPGPLADWFDASRDVLAEGGKALNWPIRRLPERRGRAGEVSYRVHLPDE